MQLNPEFRRYIWLEISPQRLIAMPAILGAIFLLLWVSGGDEIALRHWSLGIYLLLVLLWGPRLAASSVVSEIRARTWDWQRMSAIGPWQMTWGKLFGSTIFVWFGGSICLVVFAFDLVLSGRGGELSRMIFLALACAVLAHAVSLATSMLWERRRGVEKRSVVAQPQFLGILVGGYTFFEASGYFGAGSDELASLAWHGMTFNLDRFVLVSVAIFLAWAVLAVYRLMQAELQVRQRPWAWAAFAIFLMVYLSGLPALSPAHMGNAGLLTARLLLALAVALMLAYATYFLFEKDPISLRGLVLALKGGDARRALRLLPQWLIITVITALVALAFVISVLLLNGLWVPSEILFGMGFRQASVLLTVGLLGFLLRDLAIILLLNLRGGRPHAAALVYLLVLHILVPALMGVLGLGGLAGLVSPYAQIPVLPLQDLFSGSAPVQLPDVIVTGVVPVPWLIALGPLPQVALLFVFLAGRWRRFQAAIEESLAHEAV